MPKIVCIQGIRHQRQTMIAAALTTHGQQYQSGKHHRVRQYAHHDMRLTSLPYPPLSITITAQHVDPCTMPEHLGQQATQ
jgi:hypothetical protein